MQDTLDSLIDANPFVRSFLNTTVFVFGYGSLIHPKSRGKTILSPRQSSEECDVAVPCVVHDLVRSWNYNCRDAYTAVGVRRVGATTAHASAIRQRAKEKGEVLYCNGMLVPIPNPNESLPRLDEREKNYRRVKIDPASVELLLTRKATEAFLSRRTSCYLQNVGLLQDLSSEWELRCGNRTCGLDAFHQLFQEHLRSDRVSLYVYETLYTNKIDHFPTHSVPLAQSYIDIVVEGCLLSLGVEFAYLFAVTTFGWSTLWINDREWPLLSQKYRRNEDERRLCERLWAPLSTIDCAGGSPSVIDKLLLATVSRYMHYRV